MVVVRLQGHEREERQEGKWAVGGVVDGMHNRWRVNQEHREARAHQARRIQHHLRETKEVERTQHENSGEYQPDRHEVFPKESHEQCHHDFRAGWHVIVDKGMVLRS